MLKHKIKNKKNLKNKVVLLSKFHLKYIESNVTILVEQFIESIYLHALINLNGTVHLLTDEKDCIKGVY